MKIVHCQVKGISAKHLAALSTTKKDEEKKGQLQPILYFKISNIIYSLHGFHAYLKITFSLPVIYVHIL